MGRCVPATIMGFVCLKKICGCFEASLIAAINPQQKPTFFALQSLYIFALVLKQS